MSLYSFNLVRFVREYESPKKDFFEKISGLLLAPAQFAFGYQIIRIDKDHRLSAASRKVEGVFFWFLAILAALPISFPLIYAGMRLRRLSSSYKSDETTQSGSQVHLLENQVDGNGKLWQIDGKKELL